ncbi:hypothetical protein C7954_11533 [Halanaerobium congolense]|uniref:Uncharacterized protein n=2 Tax=Halanaerobium congolense TaxID=54121 RepID=A0A4R8GDW3_9FIRM|nr:hypothetical protein C7954_11533 [Halanaerobium congolense]
MLILILLIFLMFVFPFSLPFIINNLILDFPYLTSFEAENWMSFFGSYSGGIITGFITLYVLYMTLKKNTELQDEKNRLSIIPYLVFESILFSEIEEEKHKIDFNKNFVLGNQDLKRMLTKNKILIKVKNIGLGNIVDLKIKRNFAKFNGHKLKLDSNSELYSTNEKTIQTSVNVLKQEEEKIYKIIISNYAETKEHGDSFSLIFEFEDFIGNVYNQKVEFKVLKPDEATIASIENIEAPKHIRK